MDSTGLAIGLSRYGRTRHPFRTNLPRHVLRRRKTRFYAISTEDVKDFLLAYTACLLALMTFIG